MQSIRKMLLHFGPVRTYPSLSTSIISLYVQRK